MFSCGGSTTTVKRILQYFNDSLKTGIIYQATTTKPKLLGYTDLNWAGNKETRQLTDGYLLFLGRVPFSWQSKRQLTVALSSCKAEYMATTQATKEAIWLKKLLGELDEENVHCYLSTIPIQSDNQGSMALAVNLLGHSKCNHIDIQYHFVREQLAWDIMFLNYILINNMAGNGLTKALPKNPFQMFKRQLVLSQMTSQ